MYLNLNELERNTLDGRWILHSCVTSQRRAERLSDGCLNHLNVERDFKNLLNPDFLISVLHGYLVSPTHLLLKVFLSDAENLSRYLVPPNHSDWNLSRSSPVFMLSPQFADKYDKIWFITLSGETCAIHQIGGRGLLQSKRGSNHAKVTIAFATI